MTTQYVNKPDSGDDTVPRLFLRRAREWKTRTAFRYKQLGVWGDITWERYHREVEIAAMAMHTLGMAKGECVSVLSNGRPEWLYCDLGCICTGGITVGIYTTNAPDEVEFILSHSDSVLYFAEDEEQLDKALQVRNSLPLLKKIIVFDMKGLRGFSDPQVISYEEFREIGIRHIDENPGLFDRLTAGVGPEDTCFIVYTSGTTGRPKGAMISHKNVIWTNGQLVEIGQYTGREEVLSFLPLCHVAERNNTTFMQLMCGEIVNFAEKMDTVPNDLREVEPQLFFSVPRFWEKFYSSVFMTIKEALWIERKVFFWAIRIGEQRSAFKLAGKKIPPALFLLNALADFLVFRNTRRLIGLNRATHLISGGAPIAPEILRFFHAIGLEVGEVYGQTEDTGPTSIQFRGDIKLGTVGKPIPGIEVKIAEDGEIMVKGPNVFQGYLKDTELTREYVKDGWLHSGDIGALDEDGYLTITGRKKDILITAGGKNITPQYIENKLKASIYINDAVVIGDRRPYLTCLVMIDKENVTDYAQKNRVPFTTFKSLCHQKEVIDLIDGEVRRVNAELARVENIRKFSLIDVELQAEDPELTATMKLKRNYVNKKYKEMIEGMYRG